MKAVSEEIELSGNTGNSLLQGRGVCDPHVHVFGDREYMYATHDASPENDRFIMKDWWIWSSPDLVHWTHECSLRPEMTYLKAGFSPCWASDAAERYGRCYGYFSEANKRTGVFIDDDGAPYIVVGVWEFYIARLNEDMVSLSEPARRLDIRNPAGIIPL